MYDPLADRVVDSMMSFHGNEIRFPVDKAIAYGVADDLSTWQWRGPNYGKNWQVSNTSYDACLLQQHDAYKRHSNALTWYRDPYANDWTHPVIYIEHGSHEFYPYPWGGYYLAQAHDGDTVLPNDGVTHGEPFQFLTYTPPNVGEAGSALPDAPDAKFITHFNGFYGVITSTTATRRDRFSIGSGVIRLTTACGVRSHMTF